MGRSEIFTLHCCWNLTEAEHLENPGWEDEIKIIPTATLVIGPRILIYIIIENQQMHQNNNFIVTSSHTLLHLPA
jgi:hypothetical protein